MERLDLAISGVEQALRPVPSAASAPRAAAGSAPAWPSVVRQQLPGLVEALGAEHTEAGDDTFAARGRRLAVERNRLVRRLRQLTPELGDGCLATGPDAEQLRRMLLRLVHDISHHQQRVNDLVYDAGWRDVGGSE